MVGAISPLESLNEELEILFEDEIWPLEDAVKILNEWGILFLTHALQDQPENRTNSFWNIWVNKW